jgi:hypothetical protein
MKRFALLIALIVSLGLAATGCKKKEAAPPEMPPQAAGPQGQPGQQQMPPGHGEGGPGNGMGGGAEKKIVVPDDVKKAWKGAKIEVEYKAKKAKKTFTVDLNSEFKVPDSDLTLKIGEFLPHFAMNGDAISSASAKLENPALRVEIKQGGKEVFKGWLFGKFPAVHPFQHDQYGVIMLEPIKK